jgi:hypothetical protein
VPDYWSSGEILLSMSFIQGVSLCTLKKRFKLKWYVAGLVGMVFLKSFGVIPTLKRRTSRLSDSSIPRRWSGTFVVPINGGATAKYLNIFRSFFFWSIFQRL